MELPPHHATLLSLHSAIEHALVVHLATAGTSGSAIDERASEYIRVPDLITYTALRPLVERSCGRQFAKDDLARLVWLWGADEDAQADQRTNIGFEITRCTGKASDDYMLGLQIRLDVDDDDAQGIDGTQRTAKRKRMQSSDSTPPREMGIVPPRTPPLKHRTIHTPGSREPPQSPSPSPRIAASPVLGKALTPPTSPSKHLRGSPHLSSSRWQYHHQRMHSGGSLLESLADNPHGSPARTLYARRGISLVALWNNGMERRKKLVRQRLSNFSRDLSVPSPVDVSDRTMPSTPKKKQRTVQGAGGLLTPSSSREEGWVPGQHRIQRYPDVPSAASEEDETVVRVRDTKSPDVHAMQIPKAKLPGNDVTQPVSQPEAPVSPAKPSRVEAARQAHQALVAEKEAALGRKLSLAERIRTKQDAVSHAHNRATTVTTSAHAIASAARQRASLSRLQDVAESVYMLFVSSTHSHEKALFSTPLPLADVLRAITQSSRTAMSTTEARDALDRLSKLAPGFIDVIPVGARHWVKLIGKVHEPHTEDTLQDSGVLPAVRRCIRNAMDSETIT